MKTAIQGVYKGVREVKGGSFIDNNGNTIKYDNFYKIIFDQVVNGMPKETVLKISKDIALNITPVFKPYDNIVINLDIAIYNNRDIVIKVVSIEKK